MIVENEPKLYDKICNFTKKLFLFFFKSSQLETRRAGCLLNVTCVLNFLNEINQMNINFLQHSRNFFFYCKLKLEWTFIFEWSFIRNSFKKIQCPSNVEIWHIHYVQIISYNSIHKKDITAFKHKQSILTSNELLSTY